LRKENQKLVLNLHTHKQASSQAKKKAENANICYVPIELRECSRKLPHFAQLNKPIAE
jgi:hypothetical protein